MVGKTDDIGLPQDTMSRLPAELRASVDRHQRNLADLIARLRSAGMPADVIAGTVHQLVVSYETELLAAISALAWETADA